MLVGDEPPSILSTTRLLFEVAAAHAIEEIVEAAIKKPSKKLWQKIMEFAELHPTWAATIARKIVLATPAELSKETVNTVVESSLAKEPVIIIAPHWSVLDSLLFLRLQFEVNQDPRIKEQERSVKVVAPASTKFFNGLMSEGIFVAVAEELGMIALQVVQVQDEETRTQLDRTAVRAINSAAWRSIFTAFTTGDIVGLFPEGTRSIDRGTGAAPPELLARLDKHVPSNALIVPAYLKNADEVLGKDASPSFHRIPKMIYKNPIRFGDMKKIGEEIGCAAADVARVISLVDFPERWGALSEPIKKHRAIHRGQNG